MGNVIDLSFFNDNDTVVVGLSGGADSVALTHMLKFQKEKNINVIACHLNHNLRGQESIRDCNFVKDICNKWHIQLIVEEVNLKELSLKTGKGLEECGRDCRYDLFERVRAQYNAQYIATAHTLSDNLETILFNMSRGCGLNGLCGIPTTRGKIVRPILNLTRNDIEDYCKKNNLEYVVDSTNLTLDYTRNKIRHIIIPELRNINSNLEGNVSRLVKSIKEDLDFIESETIKQYELCRFKNNSLNLSNFFNLHKSIQKRIILMFLSNNNLEISEKYVSSILSIIYSKYGKFNIAKNKFIVFKDNILSLNIVDDKQIKQVYQSLEDGVFESNTGINYKINTLDTYTFKSFNKIYKNMFDISIDCGKIIGSVIIRNRLPKDEIKLSDKVPTKSLKKIYQEKHIDKEYRKKLFVLSDDMGVIAVEGIGVAHRVKCDENTKTAIRITQI